jgi:phage baseplate assembly protein V
VSDAATRIVQNLITRGVVVSVYTTAKMTTVRVITVDSDDTEAELFEPHGFTSAPLVGAEVIVVRIGGTSHPVALLSADRRYRPTGLDTEPCIYDDQGQKVTIARNGIEVETTKYVAVDSLDVRLGTGADAALVRWPELLAYLSGATFPVTGVADPVTHVVTGTAGPTASPPGVGCATTTVKAK